MGGGSPNKRVEQNATSLVDEALLARRCVISVMGAHAGEDAAAIFSRKIGDCRKVGRTFWVARSAKARPAQVRAMCNGARGYVLFVEPAAPGGARPTSASESATEYSSFRVTWFPLPSGIGPVTGQVDDSAAALVLDQLVVDVDSRTVDLWSYADNGESDKPLRIILGLCTVCAVRKDMSGHPERMKSHHRRIVGVARLVSPYCVWVR